MSQVVLDAIAAEVAKLTRVVDAPTGPLGYGADLACSEDLTESMEEVGGLTTRVLAEAILRRLDTPRGTLPDVRGTDLRDWNYGIDLRSYLNRATTDDEIRGLASNIRSELTKDDRIATVVVTVTPSPTGSSLAIDLLVTPVDPSVGIFALVLAVTSASVLIEEMRSGGGTR